MNLATHLKPDMPCLLILMLALVIPLTAGENRTWTNPDGSKNLKAVLLSLDKDSVTLRTVGGWELSIGIEKIHADDHVWLRTNQPTESKKVPDEAVVFDTSKFGDNRKTVREKMELSKMVEANLGRTFFGRTGINGIYRTIHKIGGLHCYLFFRLG